MGEFAQFALAPEQGAVPPAKPLEANTLRLYRFRRFGLAPIRGR